MLLHGGKVVIAVFRESFFPFLVADSICCAA